MIEPLVFDHRRALDAFYVDFEGFRGRPPSLVGVLQGDHFETTLLDERLAAPARALGVALRGFEEWLERLLRQAERVDAAIVAYSPHEEEVVKGHAPRLAMRFVDRAVNAQPVVRSWARGNGIAVPRGARGLKAYADLHGLTYPPELVAESVPKRLAAAFAVARKHPDWDLAPEREQERFRALLDYNRLDCTALRALTVAALRD